MRALGVVLFCIGCSPPPPPVIAAPPPSPPRIAPAKQSTTDGSRPFDVARIARCARGSLALDDTTAYVTCQDGAVYAAPFGSAPRVIARGSGSTSNALAVDATRVFFMSKGNEISVVSKHGGAPAVFHKGLQAIALAVTGSDVIVSAFKHGIVRVPLNGAPAQLLVPTSSPRVLTVADNTVFFLEQVAGKVRTFAVPLANPTVTDLGEVPWVVEQIAAAGGRLFDGQEVEVATATRRDLPAGDCTAFVSDGRFVFAACIGEGILARGIASSTFRPVVDVLVHETLALNAGHLCWADRGAGDVTYVRCVERPKGLL